MKLNRLPFYETQWGAAYLGDSYYMILLQKEDLELIKQNKTNIITILDKKARRVFAKKELGMTEIQIDEIESEEETLED